MRLIIDKILFPFNRTAWQEVSQEQMIFKYFQIVRQSKVRFFIFQNILLFHL
jgi:hypothetical protein